MEWARDRVVSMVKRTSPWRIGIVPVLCLLAWPLAPAGADETAGDETHHGAPVTPEPNLTLDGFLDRLMVAESGGNDLARNPRSTAVGAYQFIASTFLLVVRRHFAAETAALGVSDILKLRTDRAFARRAAEAYTKDNARHLAGRGLAASFPNLRLAYLVGPSGAVKVLSAKPETKVEAVLSASALRANPFLGRMTVADLIARSARDLSVAPDTRAGLVADLAVPPERARPRIAVRCSLARPSCQRWLRLAEARLQRKERAAKKP